jgi:pyruvate formate lyase activating enzyme
VSNVQILENLKAVREFMRSQARPIKLWIRTPLIPDATASDENLIAIGRYLAGQFDGAVARWELCAFNNMCRDQYARLGLEWTYAKMPLMTRLELAHCEQVARSSGFHPELILATGATRAVEPT